MNSLSFILFVIIFATTVAQSNINVQPAIESVNVQTIAKTSRRGSGRITNGTFVRNISEFPYQVGVASYDTDLARYWCGGSLISNQWILTAAHCLIGKVESIIYIGLVDKDADHQFQVGKSNYIIHKNYVDSTKLNDIALIKLPIPIQLSNYVNIITVDKDPSLIKWVNKDAVVSGWGASFTGGFTNSKLQYAEVKILSNSKCIQAVGSNLVPPSKICQKVINNKGICQGDSGGPLAATENGRRILIGITSFIVKNFRQCETDTPRVFTRVASYHQWICENTEKTVC